VLYFIDADAEAGHYKAERNDSRNNIGALLTGLAEGNDGVERNKHYGHQRTANADEQEDEDAVDPSSAPVAFVIRILLHAAARPNAAMEDLGDLEANVRTCAHVANPPTFRVRVFEPPEKTDFKLALFSAFWAGVARELVKAYHNGHLAALGIQSRYIVIHHVLRNKSAAVAERVPLLFQECQR
jgi:hypothetical protein